MLQLIRAMCCLISMQVTCVQTHAQGEPLPGNGTNLQRDDVVNSTPDWLIGQSVNFDDLGQIRTVYLGDRATDEIMVRLCELPALRRLYFSGSGELTIVGVEALAQLQSLEQLELHKFGRPADPQAAVTADEAVKSVGQLISLRELAIDSCGLTDHGVAELKNLTELTLLSLPHNQITDASLQTIGKLKRLKSLDLSCQVRHANYGTNRLTDAGMESLKDLSAIEYINIAGTGLSTLKLDFPGLKSLSLSSTFNDRGIADRDIFQLQRFPELQRLTIRADRVTDTGIAALKRLKNLSSLEISCPSVTDEGVHHLVDLPLTRLALYNVELTDEGLGFLASISTLESLSVANADNTTIEGFQQLKSLSRLEDLSLHNFQAAGSRVGFSVLKHLRTLHFEMAHLEHWTQEDLDRLGALLPATQITVGTGAGIYTPQESEVHTGWKIPPRK